MGDDVNSGRSSRDDHARADACVGRIATRHALGLDLRSLAMFRIGLGLLLLADLAIRATALTAHYTDRGVLPRSLLIQRYMPDWHWSVHLATGSTGGMSALFIVQAALAIMLILGLKTRLATIASWLLLVSLHNRNHLVLNAGDSLFRLLLFWGMFLPLHARWSLDARASPALVHHRQPHCTGGTAAYVLQICFLYWFAALLKSGPRWWDGEAVYYALNLDYFATSFGVWIRQIDWLLPWLTWGTLFWELLGPLLLFMPVWHGGFRTLCVLGFTAMHLGFLACMDIELFPLICITAWIALLPPWFWNHLARRWPRLREPESRSETVECHGRSAATVRDSLALFFIVFILAWNIRELDYLRWKRLVPGPLDAMGRVMRLDQNWGVFAPSPVTDDGWFVFDAELANGRHVDLLTGRSPVSFEKPALVSATLPHRRWGKYLERLKLVRHADQRPLLCRYLTWNWNRTHATDEMLRELRLYFVREDTRPTGISDPRIILMIECP